MSDAMHYTHPDTVTAVRVTAIPVAGRTMSGYGGRVPTRYMVRLASVRRGQGARWHRVYAMVYGNSATVYITRGGVDYIIDPATEGWLDSVGSWADRLESPVATAVRPVTA